MPFRESQHLIQNGSEPKNNKKQRPSWIENSKSPRQQKYDGIYKYNGGIFTCLQHPQNSPYVLRAD